MPYCQMYGNFYFLLFGFFFFSQKLMLKMKIMCDKCYLFIYLLNRWQVLN